MSQCALYDVGKYLHIIMWVSRESSTSSDDVLIDHSEAAEAHVSRIEVLSKGKAVFGF